MQARNSTPEPGRVGPVQILSGDLSQVAFEGLLGAGCVAWDIETNGLDPETSEIGTCQLHAPSVGTFVVKDLAGRSPALLARLLADASVVKVFHHAPFDLSFMAYAWKVEPSNIRCTKIAAKIVEPRVAPGNHSLKYLMRRHFGVELDKSVRFTDWTADALTSRQVAYAVGDVELLLELYGILYEELSEKNLSDLYMETCKFLPTQTRLRLLGCPNPFDY
ncbi:ribonuclease D [Kitasatospora sp. NPDC004289]